MSLFYKFYFFIGRIIDKRGKSIRRYKQKLTARAESSGVVNQGFTLICPSYKKYFYCDKTTGEGYFFRCKPNKENGKYPVVIYHHGGGWNRAGKNNMQLFEFSKLMKKLNKQKCHRVAIHLDVTCDYNVEAHSRALESFIEYLRATYNNVDLDRVYLAGTSHGGYACVYEVLRNPDKYAAAVISMTYTFNDEWNPPEKIRENDYVRSLTAEDYKTLSRTPFYASWAKNDHMHMVTSNELLLKNIKENNGTIKSKIYETGAHTIYSDFYKNSDWDEWMFSQNRRD